MLSIVGGTYLRKYGDYTVAAYILGSDMFEYPYYLNSVEQILNNMKSVDTIAKRYADYTEADMDEFVEIDPRIDINLLEGRWLHFSDCMNNGGTSRLFIDFDPVNGGVKGQVVKFLHDPDEYSVLADSFDEYLQMLMDEEYQFYYAEEEDEDDE